MGGGRWADTLEGEAEAEDADADADADTDGDLKSAEEFAVAR